MSDVSSVEVQLFDALARLDDHAGGSQSTSVRMSRALHDALLAAVRLGLEGSFNAAVGTSVETAVRDFARHLALRRHYEAFPEDRPSRAEVTAALVRGTDDPLAGREDLLHQAEAWLLAHERDVTVETVLALAHSFLDAAAA